MVGFRGRLGPSWSAKKVIWEYLQCMAVRGNLGAVIEFLSLALSLLCSGVSVLLEEKKTFLGVVSPLKTFLKHFSHNDLT